MEELELISFKIISAVGAARSNFINAIQEAKQGNVERARELMNEGESFFTEGHHAHMEILTMQANGQNPKLDLLFIHAEDQMMSAETMKIIAQEFIELYYIVRKGGLL